LTSISSLRPEEPLAEDCCERGCERRDIEQEWRGK
jgi:hypothetical protein